MNAVINPGASVLYETEGAIRTYVLFFCVSTACHIIVLIILIIAPFHRTGRIFTPSVIRVDLVSFSAQGAVQEKERQVEAKPYTAAPEEKQASPVKTKAEAKKPIKKETFNTSKTVKSSDAKIKKDADKAASGKLEKVFDRLKNKVEQENAARDSVATIGSGVSGAGTGVKSDLALTQMDIYKVEIYSIIQSNWSFPDRLAGNQKNLMTVLVIRIMPNGDIRDHWFEKKSGNSYLDDSSLRAVLKANPLPPLPPGYRKPYFEVGLRFTPSGVR